MESLGWSLHTYLRTVGWSVWAVRVPVDVKVRESWRGRYGNLEFRGRMTADQQRAMECILLAVEQGMLEFDEGSESRESLSAWRSSLCEVLGAGRLRVLPQNAQQLLAFASTRPAG